MKKTIESNMYSASAVEVWNLFGDYVDGNANALALVLSETPLGNTACEALAKSFAALGYGNDACAFATLAPRGQTQTQAVHLDAQALFMLIEGLDPVSLVCADAQAIKALEGAYRTQLKPDAAERVFGRPAALLADFEGMLASDDGKQAAWRILKTMPRFA